MITKPHKKLFSLALFTLLAPQALQALTQTVNDIELTTSDCAENSSDVLVYGSKPITAEQFLQKGIHPIRLKISNKSTEPVIISSKSLCLQQVNAYDAACMFHVDNQFTSSLLFDVCLLSTGVNIFAYGGSPVIFSFVFGFLPGSAVGAIYWFYIRGKNKQLNQEFTRALAEENKHGECMIQPGSSTTKFLLLTKSHRIPKFNFQVFDEQNRRPIAFFEVTLEA